MGTHLLKPGLVFWDRNVPNYASLRFGDARTVPMAPLTFKLRCSASVKRLFRCL